MGFSVVRESNRAIRRRATKIAPTLAERLDCLAAELNYRGNPNVTPNVARKKP